MERHRKWKSKEGTQEGSELFELLKGFDGLHEQLVSAELQKSIELRFTFKPARVVRTISMRQLTKEECEQNLGGKVWDCAVVMLRCYLEHGLSAAELHGKTVLELGSGIGLTGIACAMAGAAQTVLTDAFTVSALTDNVEANLTKQERERVQVVELKWGMESQENTIFFENFGARAPDIILASDVLYSMTAAPALLNTLLRMSAEHTKVVIAYKQRRHAETQVWTGLAAVFEIVQLRSPVLDAIERLCHVGLFELRRKPEALGIKRVAVSGWPAWLAPQ